MKTYFVMLIFTSHLRVLSRGARSIIFSLCLYSKEKSHLIRIVGKFCGKHVEWANQRQEMTAW